MIRAKLDASLKLFGPFWDAAVLCAVTASAIGLTGRGELAILALLLPLWIMSCALFGGYDCDLEDPHQTMGVRLGSAAVAAALLTVFVGGVLQLTLPVGGWSWLGFTASVALGWFGLRKLGYRVGKQLMKGSQERRQLLLVGNSAAVNRFTQFDGSDEVDVVGWVSPPGTEPGDGECLGDWSRLSAIIDERVVHEVLVLGEHKVSELRGMVGCCEEIGVHFSMDSDFLGLDLAVAQLERCRGRSLLRFTTIPFPAEALVIKRVIDVIGALVGLLVLFPVMVLVAVAVKLEDPKSPVLFRQDRSGRYGRRFRMWKFRSMVADAEERKSELDAQNEMSGAAFKIADDPRITRVGRLLRRSSMDELPQLWNVLMGQMSLVGPRPLIPREERGYERWQLRRLSVRPGITGLWQVSGRNDVDFDTWMMLDMQYLDNWTLALDVRVLLKTIPVVISGVGAS
jgi:exopolysaccharide biosynthesis polyprenyl glycosylphosphotransferase